MRGRHAYHRTKGNGGIMVRISLAALAVLIGVGAAAVSASLAQAEPAQCVYPDGTPCAPPTQGCVLPENGLPCTSRLEDVNAAIRQQLGQVLGGLG